MPQTEDSAEKVSYTIEEYLALEESATEKSEYWNGEVRAMSGGSMEHAEIIGNCIWALKNALKGKGCKVYSSELKVFSKAVSTFLYPDTTVICGDPKNHENNKNILLNPALIVEVLSPGTEGYDSVKKFDAYQRIDSLREYVLVSQDQYRVEVRTKHKDWSEFHIYFNPEDTIAFQSVPATIKVADLYDQVRFEGA